MFTKSTQKKAIVDTKAKKESERDETLLGQRTEWKTCSNVLKTNQARILATHIAVSLRPVDKQLSRMTKTSLVFNVYHCVVVFFSFQYQNKATNTHTTITWTTNQMQSENWKFDHFFHRISRESNVYLDILKLIYSHWIWNTKLNLRKKI